MILFLSILLTITVLIALFYLKRSERLENDFNSAIRAKIKAEELLFKASLSNLEMKYEIENLKEKIKEYEQLKNG